LEKEEIMMDAASDSLFEARVVEDLVFAVKALGETSVWIPHFYNSMIV